MKIGTPIFVLILETPDKVPPILDKLPGVPPAAEPSSQAIRPDPAKNSLSMKEVAENSGSARAKPDGSFKH